MKYITAFLLVVLCLIGAVALILFTRDNPQYADGEPTAIIKDWLNKQPQSTLSALDNIAASVSILDENQGQAIWREEYLGSGKWLVERASLPASNNENLTFEEWIARTRGWNESRLTEYASDLSPEEQHTFEAQLRTYNSGQQGLNIIDKWYLYEKSGIIKAVKD